MNSSDDPIDKQLRRHFQQVFDAFDVTPADSLKARVWKALPNAAPYRYLRYGALMIIVLLLTGGVYYRSRETVSPVAANAKKNIRLRAPSSRLRPPVAIAATVARWKNQTLFNVDRLIAAPIKSPDGAEPVGLGLPGPSGSLVARRTGRRPVTKRQLSPSGLGRDKPSVSSIIANPFTPARQLSFRSRTGREKSVSFPNAVGQQRPVGRQPAATLRVQTAPVPAPVNAVTPTTQLAVWSTLQPVGWQPALRLSAQLTRPVAFLSPTVSSVMSQPSRPSPLRWFVRAAPLSTYQQMTVVAKPGTQVQHVGAPSTLSGQTWGYQLTGGVTWRQWDVSVSYGQIRRWAYYELATDEYEVEPVGLNEYQVTRRAEAVAENVSLPMLGAGLSRQYTLGRQKRYYGRIGGQVTYALNSHQTLGWAQAGLGLNLSLGQTYQLQVGPAVDYGLGRLWSTERQLSIHPYLVGVSVTLRPRVLHNH